MNLCGSVLLSISLMFSCCIAASAGLPPGAMLPPGAFGLPMGLLHPGGTVPSGNASEIMARERDKISRLGEFSKEADFSSID